MVPTFSVIVPCYNQGQYLAEALDSVLAQSYTDWECVIINDNSLDDTALIAENYTKSDSRFKYVFTHNKGVSVARNVGISETTGSYILPLDADDKIAPDYLAKALAAFSQDPELTLFYGAAELFGDLTGRWNIPEYSYYGLLFMNMIYCSAIFKRNDFYKVGGYSEEMVHGLEDWDFWLRLLKDNAKVLRLSEVVFYYRKKLVSRSTELMKEEKLEQTKKQLLQRNKEVYSDYLYTIMQELEQTNLDKKEVERQLALITNSRSQKILSKLRAFISLI